MTDPEDRGGANAGREAGATAGPGGDEAAAAAVDRLVEGVRAGKHRALARAITKIENRAPGYRDLVARLHAHTGDAAVLGVTGSPGAGKSTLVDKLAKTYRDRGETVGVIAIDPASPYTGGAVLGDRIRMASNVGDMDVFFRSMSARGTLGGLSTATTDAVTALDAFGKDVVIVETVGAGQNEIDIVRTADTVAVLVPPGSGDDVQMLKAGILEIADLLVVNKADLPGADRTVQELREMLGMRDSGRAAASGRGGDATAGGHHGPGGATGDVVGPASDEGVEGDLTDGDDGVDAGGPGGTVDATGGDGDGDPAAWEPRIVETVANTGEGVEDLVAAVDDHREYLVASGELDRQARTRYAEHVRTLLREDVHDLLAEEIAERGGLDDDVDRILARDTDPYSVAAAIVDPVETCVRERHHD